MEICLKEIENSIPFFIGIIGNRYGWRPRIEEIYDSDDMRDRFKWVYDDIKNGLSVTEIEMQYGVLRRSTDMNASFYIKNNVDTSGECDYPEMLEMFKRDVRRNGRYPVYDYSTIEELAKQVESEFKLILDRNFPEEEGVEWKREATLQHFIIRQLSATYSRNDDEYRQLDDFISRSRNKYLTVFGPNGIGKSALLAYWIEQNTHQNRFDILYFFTQGASNFNHEYILDYYKMILLQKHPEIAESGNDLLSIEDIIQKSENPAVIILDGIEPFQDSDNWTINSMDWLPCPPDGSKVIISSSYSEKSIPEFFMKGRDSDEDTLTVGELDEKRKSALIEQYLHHFGKHLDASQAGRIVTSSLTSNPRILVTLLSDLVNNCTYTTLDSSINSFISTSGINGFYQVYIRHLEQNYGKDLICGTLLLAALPVFGLIEQSFKEILQVRQLNWSAAFCALTPCFIIYEGCIRISDRTFKDVVLEYYEGHVNEYRDKIIAYLEEKYKAAEVSINKNKICEELCEQYFQKGDADALYEMISDFDVFLFLKYKRASKVISIGGAKQIYRYWEWLYSVNPFKYNLGVYLRVAAESPELYLKQFSELTDCAAHVSDDLSVLCFVLKAMDLVRCGYGLDEEDAKYFAGGLSLAVLGAGDYGLARIAHNLDRIQKSFLKKGTLPKKQSKWEMALRRFVKAESSNVDDIKVGCFESAISLLEGTKLYIKDIFIIKYKLACAERDLGLLSQAEVHVDGLLNEIGSFSSGGYNDEWECFKARVMGLQVFVKKDLGKYEDALESCERTICHWENIEDWRIENGNYIATIDAVEYFIHVYDEIEGLLNDRN